MDKLTREEVLRIRERLENACSIIGQVTGVSIKLEHGSYSPLNASFKLTIATLGTQGNNFENTREGIAFKSMAGSVGLQASDLGRVVDYYGTELRIIGWNTKAPKYPIILRREHDGSIQRSSGAFTKANLERQVRTNESQT